MMTPNRSAYANWPKWARLLTGRFAMPRGFNPDAWEEVIDSDMGDGNWSAEEIEQTLEWMQSPGQKWADPQTARDIIVAMRTRRKGQRNDAEPPSDRECIACRQTGWVRVAPKLGPSPTIEERTAPGYYEACVPCTCGAGRVLWTLKDYREVSDERRAELGRMAILGAQQRASYERWAVEEAEKSEHADFDAKLDEYRARLKACGMV